MRVVNTRSAHNCHVLVRCHVSVKLERERIGVIMNIIMSVMVLVNISIYLIQLNNLDKE